MTTALDSITWPANPVDMVASSDVDPLQMGVTIQLGGVNNWIDYIDDEMDNGMFTSFTDDDRDDYRANYDGYVMRWAFDTSRVVSTQDGAIDAACISSSYGGGGYCAGIEYVGTVTQTPELWAQWSTQSQFDEFTTNSKLDGNDDTENWWTEETGFRTTWTAWRWQPRYEFDIAYYDDEFRFTPACVDCVARSYSTPDVVTFTLGTAVSITLLQGFTTLVSATVALTAAALMAF